MDTARSQDSNSEVEFNEILSAHQTKIDQLSKLQVEMQAALERSTSLNSRIETEGDCLSSIVETENGGLTGYMI